MSLDETIKKLQECSDKGHGKEDIEIYIEDDFGMYSEIKSVNFDGNAAVEIVIR